MMYSGSSCDSGQMASGQSTCRPVPGPTVNWLEMQSKHDQRQQQKQDGEPVAVGLVTNGTGAASERSDNDLRPYANNQPDPTSPAHLAFLYDRPQQPVESPLSGAAVYPNGFAGMTSPHAGEYRSLSRALPAPVHHHQRQQETSTAARTSADSQPPSSEYNPFSRATPAPIQQHAAQRPATMSSAGADAGTPSSRRTTQQGDSQPHTAEVSRQMSQLAVADGLQHTSAPVAAGSRPVGNHRACRQPPPSAFSRRQSAPGPIGPEVEPGSRKPWSYTPSFGVRCGAGRVAPASSRPPMQPASQNGTYTARVSATDGLQSSAGRDVSDSSPNVNGDAVDGASIRYKLREGEDPIADYDETSIRYRGRTNPSKTFRLLQSATGSDSDSDSTLAYATARRRRRQPSRDVLDADNEHQQPHADDIVDISYVGANIPSRTFRILQQAVGVMPPQVSESGRAQCTDVSGTSVGSRRNVRVVHLRPMKKHASVDNILACSDL